MTVVHLPSKLRNSTTGLPEVGGGGTDWIDLTEDRDSWQALVNAVMNIEVP